jgi:hypothetical protein
MELLFITSMSDVICENFLGSVASEFHNFLKMIFLYFKILISDLKI